MFHVEFTVSRKHLLSLLGMLILAVVLIPAVARGGHQFTDVGDTNIFHADIAWMANEGITLGCNPPANDKYCPGDTVTREQMAAFMHRLDTNRIAPLEARVNALEALLAGVTRNGDTLTFSAINLQVVNGQGETETSNGLGNVIIGYNEDTGAQETRTGSHYVIVGKEHTWTSYGGIVAGYSNNATGIYASVTGGTGNTASGSLSLVSGGLDNTASAYYTSVSGGWNNTASGNRSSVSGGRDNLANGAYSSVSGGRNNTASDLDTSVSGGYSNTASGNYASVSGGYANDAIGESSSVSGGSLNNAEGDYSSVSGGWWNFAKGGHSSILGGPNTTVAGGYGIYPT